MNSNFESAQKKFNQLLDDCAIESTISEMQTAGITGITADDVAFHLSREFESVCADITGQEKSRLHTCLILRISHIIDMHRSSGDAVARHYFWN